jgi:phenylacetate-CoA ligase
LRIEDNYSSQEVGPIAIQCAASGLYHVMGETLIVEVLDASGEPCAEGEAGRVVVTDLHNFASPMIRYDIGDFAVPGAPCPCGRGLPTLKRILGRERNLIVKADGSRHWPLVGFHRFDEAAPVRQYQFVQHTTRDIEFKVVTDEPLTPGQRAKLAEIANSALGGGLEIRITESRARLPAGANGKFEEFVSMVRP